MKKNKTNIIIGNWSTKGCVSKKTFLNKMTKRIILKLRYYNFLQRLTYKCKVYNKNLYVIDEAYTSKVCSNCCNENVKLGSSKTFNCKNCNISLDRDFNGCRNILLKIFSKTFQTVII